MNAVIDELSKLRSDGIHLSMPELVRFKALAKMISLSPSARAASQMAGAERSLFKGRGMEFDEARHYQAGDDIRSIDWRVTARTGRTHTKIFREERERPVFMFVDLSASMHFGTQLLFKSVQAAHLAALTSWAAVGRGDKLGGIVFNEISDFECKPRAQTKNALHFMNAMANLQNEAIDALKQEQIRSEHTSQKGEESNSAKAFLKALQRMHYLAKPGSLIHIISDCQHLNDMHLSMIGDLSRHCELKVSIIQDPFEQELPTSNGLQTLSVTDGQQRGAVMLGDKAYTARYRSAQLNRLEGLKKAFGKAKLIPRLVSAAHPLDVQLSAHQRGFDVGERL